MTRRESSLRTLAVAAGVALFCSLLVSTVVYWLRPMQLAYADIERNFAILVAAGLAPRDESLGDREIVARFVDLEPRIFDRETQNFTSSIDPITYEYRAAAADPGRSTPLPADRDLAGIGTLARYLPLYVSSSGGSARRIVIPIYGRGMWSTIHGYLSLNADLQTIAGIAFYEHGETPGIGDRIQSPDWLGQWPGTRIYAMDDSVQIHFAPPSSNLLPDYRIDTITGATVTVAAVERMLRFWLGPDGYRPALQLIAAEGATP
jgi:Na+-transporting NADH:ubiquinone oxidoreductase subunit C